MLPRVIATIVFFAAMPALGAVSVASAADRSVCFKDQKAQLAEPCYNGLQRGKFEFNGTQNGAGQPHNPGGHGGFPGANGGNLDGPNGGHGNPGGNGNVDGGGPKPG
jgi:hypothetical protein